MEASKSAEIERPRTDVGSATWAAGPPDSELGFSLRHLVFTQILGRVTRWSAEAVIDLEVPSRSWVDVIVDASSLETGDAERDEHVRSPEFLDARSFPEIRFHSRAVRPLENDRQFILEGDLTIRHITRPISLQLDRVDRVDAPTTEGRPVETIALTGRAMVDRQEFGLRWNQDLDRKGVVVGNQVELKLRIQAHALTKKA